MKILKVQFQNLNSLAGSWVIDFTSPEISGDGIFAITGPTGAGKSTILDAVCLALYGRTPRLEHVNKTTNEIMTRQTGECSSEIEFLTSKGRFRCHWSQHRARKAASGDLQPQKHEIVDCTTNKVLESKIKLVKQKVAEVTGMDFNQFTRSILLAQGEFNTFLKADPDKRSPILEQITGTDIYSRISIKVHEITREKQDKLQRLSTEIDGFLPLSDEQEKTIRNSLTTLDGKTKELDKAIQDNIHLVDWHTRQEKLQADLNNRQKEAVQLELQYQKLQPEREKRTLIEEARKLEPLYQRLLDLRKLQNEETEDLAEENIRLIKLNATLEKLEKETGHQETRLLTLKKDREEKNHLFKDIRARDLEIQHLKAQSLKLTENVRQGQKKVADLRTNVLAINRQLETCAAEISVLEKFRHDNQADQRLVDELSGIKEQFGAYRQLCEAASAAQTNENELQTQISDLDKTVLQQTEQLTDLGKDLHKTDEQLRQRKEDYKTLLGEQTPEELYRKSSELQTRMHSAEMLGGFHSQLRHLREKAEFDQAHEQKLERAIQTTTLKLQAVSREVELNTEAVERQQELALLASKLKNYEDERAQLAEHMPCPLCGSFDHPYVNKGCPETADEQEKLQHIQKRLKRARIQQSEITADLSRLEAEQKQLASSKKEAEQNRLQLEESIEEAAKRLNMEITATFAEDIAVLAREMKKDAQSLKERRTQAESLKETIDKLGSLRETANVHVTRAERTLHSSAHSLETLRDKIETARQNRVKLHEQVTGTTEAIAASLRNFTTLKIAPDNLQNIFSELEQKKKVWLQKTEKLQSLLSTRQEHESQREQNSTLVHTLEQEQKSTTGELSLLNSRLDMLRQKRQELYGDNNPDEEEQHLLSSIEFLEKNLASLKKQLETEQHRRTSLSERREHLTRQTGARKTQLAELNRQFISSLHETSITDEEDFLLYRPSETDFAALCRILDDVREKITSNSAIVNALQESVDTEQARKLTDSSRREIEAIVSRLQTERTGLQQETGALTQQLQDNKRQMQIHAERIKKFTEQKKETERWARLHDLIGSADGKKFRNFAQGITFDLMLDHANTTLQRMSDRYILVREPSRPLELYIIDNYQAGEIRTIKNLSGGESFLVSMALALGLSSMASRNVQVDSLFLDEGFGTLDEETLQTALDILSSLHQQGKLIGVISHVTGLQERISARIQVNRGIGGRSTLSGAGVAKPGE